MANTFLQFLMRRLKWEVIGSILGMIPKKVRKIVGWILLIFGAVALLRLYPGGLFFGLTDLMFMITFFGGIFSFSLGRMFLRH